MERTAKPNFSTPSKNNTIERDFCPVLCFREDEEGDDITAEENTEIGVQVQGSKTPRPEKENSSVQYFCDNGAYDKISRRDHERESSVCDAHTYAQEGPDSFLFFDCLSRQLRS